MKISTVERNGIKNEVIETISCLVARVPWPERRQAMADEFATLIWPTLILRIGPPGRLKPCTLLR